MNDLSHLNPPQREAAQHTEGPLLILAGAGSGKTTVLIERCARIIQSGTPPWRILAITFTNKAAGELKERLERSLGPGGRDVWAHTFHAACIRFLRRDITRLGYGPSFTVYDQADQKRVMKDVIKRLNIDEKRFPPQALLGQISAAKDKGLDGRRLQDSVPGDAFLKMAGECYTLYQKALTEANALDFDDIIALTVRLFDEFPDVLAEWQSRFSYILVDEYQDTNNMQYRLVTQLAASHRNLCVVGDDDQSIYRFRGATIENILSFEQQYPDAKVIRLEQNYRSTGSILKAANAVIARNTGRKGKTLWTGNPEGDPVTRYEAQNDSEEARFISETVLDGIRKGASFKDFCVLYRMGAQSNRIEGHLRLSGIPYRVVGGVRFFDRAEVKDMMAYLQVIHNPSDDLRLMRIINVPSRKLGEKTLSIVADLAGDKGCACFDIIHEAARYPELGRSAHILSNFARMILDLGDMAEAGDLPALYDELLKRSGYEQMLTDKPEEEGRLENIKELRSNLCEYCEQQGADASLAGFLDETALYTDLDKLGAEDDAMTLMTMHAAKGLEFPTVFLVGCEEEIFPSGRSMSDASEIEEERRLCYVAVTRARERLYVINAKERMLYGQTRGYLPSRFLREMNLEAPPAARNPYVAPEREAPKPRTARITPANGGRYEWNAPPKASAAATSALPKLKTGDTIRHKKFGAGTVKSVAPMGGDALLEITFADGDRRLMLKTAMTFITVET